MSPRTVKKLVYIVIAHGSKHPKSDVSFYEFLGRFSKTYPEKEVRGCFLDCQKPSVQEMIQQCAKEGFNGMVLLPLMFFPGKHMEKDIPLLVEEAKAKHPHIDFHTSSALANHPGLVKIVAEQARKTLQASKKAR